IGKSFKISQSEIDEIRRFVLGKSGSELDSDHILIVDASPRGTYSKAKHAIREHLDGFIAILYIAEQGIYVTKYFGNTAVYLNGIPLKSGKISVLAVGSLLRWEKDEPVYYGQVQNEFKKVADFTRTTFEAHNISYRFNSGKPGLPNILLSEESGNLVALMGASGAGKSTLLYVLNGSEKPSEGKVLINGIDIHRNPEKIDG